MNRSTATGILVWLVAMLLPACTTYKPASTEPHAKLKQFAEGENALQTESGLTVGEIKFATRVNESYGVMTMEDAVDWLGATKIAKMSRGLIVLGWVTKESALFDANVGVIGRTKETELHIGVSFAFDKTRGKLVGSSYRRLGPLNSYTYHYSTEPIARLVGQAGFLFVLNGIIRDALDDGLDRLDRELQESEDSAAERIESELDKLRGEIPADLERDLRRRLEDADPDRDITITIDRGALGTAH